MPLEGEYAPSPEAWVRAEVEHYERTGVGRKGRPVVVLSTLGASSGLLRKTPLMRVERGGVYAGVASMAGGAQHPAWYLNALASPVVALQDAMVVHELTAREVTGQERDLWWSRACSVFASYADYQSRTRRRIPVLVLEPRPPTASVAPDGLLTRDGAGVNELLGDVAKLDVQVLRRAAQQVERLVGGDALALHQDPLGLADYLA